MTPMPSYPQSQFWVTTRRGNTPLIIRFGGRMLSDSPATPVILTRSFDVATQARKSAGKIARSRGYVLSFARTMTPAWIHLLNTDLFENHHP